MIAQKSNKGGCGRRRRDTLTLAFSQGARGPRSDSGFTLIEVMVAMAVLSLVVVAVMELFGQGLNMAQKSEDTSQATFLARSKMDDLLLQKEMKEGSESGTFDEFDGRFSWETKVEEAELTHLERVDPNAGMNTLSSAPLPPGQNEKYFKTYAVHLEVTWDDRNGRMALDTLRTDYENPAASNN